jgi:hypothetical protein
MFKITTGIEMGKVDPWCDRMTAMGIEPAEVK